VPVWHATPLPRNSEAKHLEMPVEISLAFREHPDENVLEEYAFGRLNDAEAAVLEEHILVCERCRSALAETDDYIRLMKFAAARPLEIPPRRSSKRATTAAGVLTAASIALLTWLRPNPPPALVPLAAVRDGTTGSGGAEAPVSQAAAGHPLDLSISTADVPPAAGYRLDLVTSTGESIWSGPASTEDGKRLSAHVNRSLGAGMYWIRLYAQPSGLLAEYGLRVN
jgi:hypothetical protein